MIHAIAALLAATAVGHGGFAGVAADGHARPVARSADVPYVGGPVLHSNRTRLIFWAPAGSGLSFGPGYEALIERFLADVAADSHSSANVYGLSGQYRDLAGPAAFDSSYRGAVVDTDPLPPNGCSEPPPPPAGTGPGWDYCLDGAQLGAEVVNVIESHHLPTGVGDVYFLVMPDGLGSCEQAGPYRCALGGSAYDGYCAYHSVADEITYAVVPYDALPGHCQSGNSRPNSSPADPTISASATSTSRWSPTPTGTRGSGAGGWRSAICARPASDRSGAAGTRPTIKS